MASLFFSTTEHVQATTTDATPTTVMTIPLPTDSVSIIDVKVLIKTTTAFAVEHKEAYYKNDSGTITQISTTNVITPNTGDAAINLADFDFSISGTNVLVQVEGIAATTIEWFIEAHIDKH